LAVAAPDGLVVPVFAEPDGRDLADLDADIRRTVALARQGRIDQEHLVVANATLSNLGGAGVDRFQALVTPPQASVLALGRVAPRPVAIPGGLGLVLTLTAGLTVDHRVADGVDAAAVLTSIANALA
jgi:pyruvate dehydrogenase E2 component (dihydrolipoamide acetyltransferase)